MQTRLATVAAAVHPAPVSASRDNTASGSLPTSGRLSTSTWAPAADTASGLYRAVLTVLQATSARVIHRTSGGRSRSFVGG